MVWESSTWDTSDTNSAMVPRLAVPADLSRKLVYTTDFMSLEYPSIPSSPTTFEEWRGQLPHAEKRLLHKVSHSQQGTCQCKYSIGTWLPPTIMLVDYAQKLALIFIVTFFKPSITGVTNSGATLPGTHSKWQHDVPKRNKLSIGLSSSTIG